MSTLTDPFEDAFLRNISSKNDARAAGMLEEIFEVISEAHMNGPDRMKIVVGKKAIELWSNVPDDIDCPFLKTRGLLWKAMLEGLLVDPRYQSTNEELLFAHHIAKAVFPAGKSDTFLAKLREAFDARDDGLGLGRVLRFLQQVNFVEDNGDIVTSVSRMFSRYASAEQVVFCAHLLSNLGRYADYKYLVNGANAASGYIADVAGVALVAALVGKSVCDKYKTELTPTCKVVGSNEVEIRWQACQEDAGSEAEQTRTGLFLKAYAKNIELWRTQNPAAPKVKFLLVFQVNAPDNTKSAISERHSSSLAV